MTSTLDASAAQIFDKLSDLIAAPAVGTVLATATTDRTVIEQGTYGTMPDGRRVRVTKSMRVRSAGTSVPVRLEHLSPAYPARANFAPVLGGSVVTWQSPPSGIAATASTETFAPGERSAGLMVGAIVDDDTYQSAEDAFGAGAQGTTQFVLLDPDPIRPVPGIWDSEGRRSFLEATWKLRVTIASYDAQAKSRVRVRDVFEALSQALFGAAVGDEFARFVSWQAGKPTDSVAPWILTFATRHVFDGRALQPRDDGHFDDAFVTIALPGDADQPDPFRVEDLPETY